MPDLRLGVVEGDVTEQFSNVGSVLEGTDGRIYVLDEVSSAVHVFEPDGSFVRKIEGRGEGPGEFVMPRGMALDGGDTLWVVDPQAGRYSAFEPGGSFVRTHTRGIAGFSDATPPVFIAQGVLLDWGLRFPEERVGYNVAGARVRFVPLIWRNSFEQLDSLPPLEFVQEMMANQMRPQPFFSVELIVAADKSGDIWFANSREYRVYRRTLAGDTTLEFSLPAEAAAVGEAERRYVRERLGNRPIATDYMNALPDRKPILHGIIPDNAGNILVIADVEGVEPGSFIDVFRDGGEYLGRMELPTSLPLLPPPRLTVHATGRHLYTVVTDSLNVPFVVRHRIVKAP